MGCDAERERERERKKKTFQSTFPGNYYKLIKAQYTHTRLWLGGTEDLNRPVKSGLCYLTEVKVSFRFISLSR